MGTTGEMIAPPAAAEACFLVNFESAVVDSVRKIAHLFHDVYLLARSLSIRE